MVERANIYTYINMVQQVRREKMGKKKWLENMTENVPKLTNKTNL